MVVCNYDKDSPGYGLCKWSSKAVVYQNNIKNNILKIY